MIYVGVHRTDNLGDGYMGSGRLLNQAKKKYGTENFSKEILQTFQTPYEMFKAETQLVNEDFVRSKRTYNTRIGGRGGPENSRETEYFRSGEHSKNYLLTKQKAWKENKKLRQERIEQYYKNPTLCFHCISPLPYEKKRNKFCSKSCAASHNNVGRIRSEESKRKTSFSLMKRKISLGV